jgi:hypothetical protein
MTSLVNVFAPSGAVARSLSGCFDSSSSLAGSMRAFRGRRQGDADKVDGRRPLWIRGRREGERAADTAVALMSQLRKSSSVVSQLLKLFKS